MVSYSDGRSVELLNSNVLILVVVDNGIVLLCVQMILFTLDSLNPCCSGQWYRTKKISDRKEQKTVSLNPCCSGQWYRTHSLMTLQCLPVSSLNPCCSGQWYRTSLSLLGLEKMYSLNPCCSGQWYRTQPYKTLLIINKLKNFTKQIFTFLNRKLTVS